MCIGLTTGVIPANEEGFRVSEESVNTTPNDKMPWTDDRVEQLKRMWSEGLTASQIAARIGQGVTRNAVIGKVHRLGLSGRVAKVRAPRPKPPRKIYEPNLAARSSGLTVSGATALKPQFRPQPKPLPLPEPEPIRLVEVPSGEQRCSIMHLTDPPAGGRSAIRRARISASAVARLAKRAPIASTTPGWPISRCRTAGAPGREVRHDVAQVGTPDHIML